MRRTRHAALAAALAGAGLQAPTAAGACTVTATGVAFGTYNPGSATPDDGTGSIRVVCHPNEHGPEVALSAGLWGSYATRRMRNLGAGSNLNYNLYTSVAHNVVWGNGTGGTATVTLSGGTVSGGDRTFNRTIYGRVPTAQHVPAGTYVDLIMVTVTF